MEKGKIGTIFVFVICLFLTGCSNEQEDNISDKINVVAAFMQQSDNAASTWKGWGAEKLYENTGLTLELYSSEYQVEDKLKQYMVSGTIPDMIGFKDINQADLYMDAGLLLPLNDYEEWLQTIVSDPNYDEALSYSKEYLSNGTGNLYLLPLSVGQSGVWEYKEMPMLQWSAYKKIGMPSVTTLEDYLAVVKSMLSEKPLNNAGERMYGFSLYQSEKGMWTHASNLAYLYGIDMHSVSYLMETDMNTYNTTSIFREDSFYKRALSFYYEAQQSGLLDPDSMNQTYSNLERKIDSGRIMVIWNGETEEDSIDTQNEKRIESGYEIVSAKDMKLYKEAESVIGKNGYFAVYKNSDKIQEACTFLNWLYEEDTQFYLYNGPEGVVWEYDEEGAPYITEQGESYMKNRELEIEGYQGSLRDGIAPFNDLGRTPSSLTVEGYALCYKYWKTDVHDISRTQNSKDNANISRKDYLENHSMEVENTPAVYVLDVVPEDISKKVSEIWEMADDLSWQMIYAQDENDFEALWQEIVLKADQLGMQEVEEYFQFAWKDALNLAETWNVEK